MCSSSTLCLYVYMEICTQIIIGISIVPDDIDAVAININANATIQPRAYTGEDYFEPTEELPRAEGRNLAEVHTTCSPCLVNNSICHAHL